MENKKIEALLKKSRTIRELEFLMEGIALGAELSADHAKEVQDFAKSSIIDAKK